MKKIVRGNDVVLQIPVRRMVGGESYAMPLAACESVTVSLVNAYKRYGLEWTIDPDEADGNVLLARMEGDQLPCGVFALEVKGKAFGSDWRSKELEQVELVDNNASADTALNGTDEGESSVEMDTAIIVMGAPTPALTPCGSWSPKETYSRGDTVAWNGGCWWASADNTGSEPAEGSGDWVLLCQAGFPSFVVSRNRMAAFV